MANIKMSVNSKSDDVPDLVDDIFAWFWEHNTGMDDFEVSIDGIVQDADGLKKKYDERNRLKC